MLLADKVLGLFTFDLGDLFSADFESVGVFVGAVLCDLGLLLLLSLDGLDFSAFLLVSFDFT